MAKKNAIYHCPICGNMVEVVEEGLGQLVCCGKPMIKMQENSIDASREKHVPVVQMDGNIVSVSIGSTTHPMTEDHWIKWIELSVGNTNYRQELSPTDKPEVKFVINDYCSTSCVNMKLTARALCNLHGLWKNEQT